MGDLTAGGATVRRDSAGVLRDVTEAADTSASALPSSEFTEDQKAMAKLPLPFRNVIRDPFVPGIASVPTTTAYPADMVATIASKCSSFRIINPNQCFLRFRGATGMNDKIQEGEGRLIGPGAQTASVSVTWATMPGKPTAFIPAAHTHPWADLTGVPTSFPPSAHSHAIADVTGLQTALDGKQAAGGYVLSANFTWANLGGKPATFVPSAHTHPWADITDRPTIPAATPLGGAIPQALGTATAGTSSNSSREDHVHPLPTGRLTLVGTATVSETLGFAVVLGVRRYSITMAGAAVGDRLIICLTGPPSNGTIQDAYVSSANTVNVGLLVPALALGAVVAVPIAAYKVT